jgi:hypothetical protein
MKLVKTQEQFNPNPYLTKPVEREMVLTLSVKDFDKDGYEVPNPLERLYYEAERVILNHKIQYHIAPVQPWYIDAENSEQGLVLDHCMLATRWAFSGTAREQIEHAAQQRPILNKLLCIKPKWGIDFSLDWIDHTGCMEVIHIEQDFWDYEQANAAKQQLEQIIDHTDWMLGVQDLIKIKQHWIDLNSDDQSDFKAKFFGWSRAFNNRKVFSFREQSEQKPEHPKP